MKELDEGWENPKTIITSLVAWGGVGKTALVNKWLSSLGEDFRGAERVYGWSFYSQGERRLGRSRLTSSSRRRWNGSVTRM